MPNPHEVQRRLEIIDCRLRLSCRGSGAEHKQAGGDEETQEVRAARRCSTYHVRYASCTGQTVVSSRTVRAPRCAVVRASNGPFATCEPLFWQQSQFAPVAWRAQDRQANRDAVGAGLEASVALANKAAMQVNFCALQCV